MDNRNQLRWQHRNQLQCQHRNELRWRDLIGPTVGIGMMDNRNGHNAGIGMVDNQNEPNSWACLSQTLEHGALEMEQKYIYIPNGLCTCPAISHSSLFSILTWLPFPSLGFLGGCFVLDELRNRLIRCRCWFFIDVSGRPPWSGFYSCRTL
jgi:hypothetical protein